MVKEKDKLIEFAKRKRIELVFLGVAVLIGVFLGWTNVEIVIFTMFVGSILSPISSRCLAIPALFFLVLSALMAIPGDKERADEFAVYAYYFLIMAVVMGFYEIRKERKV